METYTMEEEKPVNSEVREATVRRPKQRSKALWVILGGGLVLALVALAFWLHFRYRISTDDAQVDGHIAPIAAKISGNVIEVLVNDNQQVKAGDVLVRIDPRDYQARVDQAKAALAVAESQAEAARVTVPLTRETTESGTSGRSASLITAEAQADQAKVAADQAATSDLSFARSNLVVAQANNEKAQADLARMRPLVAKAEISQQEFDAYNAAAKVAEAQVKAAIDRVQSAEKAAANLQAAYEAAQARVQQNRAELVQSKANERQVLVSDAQVVSAKARIKEAQANLETAELNLSYTTIVAPVDGQVTKKSVELGQILQPGQALLALIPLKDVWVTANFKETQLAGVQPGMPAEVDVDMYGRTIKGKVDSIAGGTGARMSLLPPENATGNYVKVVERIPVKIVFDSLPDGVILRPGMNVNATIITH